MMNEKQEKVGASPPIQSAGPIISIRIHPPRKRRRDRRTPPPASGGWLQRGSGPYLFIPKKVDFGEEVLATIGEGGTR
jgi:hypothetical protein